MIAIDTEYIAEDAVQGKIPGVRPDVRTTYCGVIQIGAIKLDEEGNEVDTLNLLIKPSFIETMPEWLVTLTRITEEQRKEGISFKEAIELLVRFIGNDTNIWVFAGDGFVFSNAIKRHDMHVVLPEFKLVKPKLEEWGLVEARFREKGLEVCSGNLYKVLDIDLPADGNAHNALHDARSMAYSVFRLLNRKA